MTLTSRNLMLTSVVIGAVAVAILALSVSTDAWLFTKETIEVMNKYENATEIHVALAHMGLWKVCTLEGEGKYCQAYTSEETEGQATSMAIMRATRFAAMFPVLSLVMITIAVILGILGNIRQDGKTLIAAVIAILAGLMLAVGIIFYISAINDEVGHRTKSSEGKKFEYEYGWSFSFAGVAFIIAEATAVVLVTQFMQRNSSKDDMVRIIPGLEGKFGGDNDEPEVKGTSNPTVIL